MTIPHHSKLLKMAEEYRLMSLTGDDVHLKVALLELAIEFEQEALVDQQARQQPPADSDLQRQRTRSSY
jgi:hypothetical protein